MYAVRLTASAAGRRTKTCRVDGAQRIVGAQRHRVPMSRLRARIAERMVEAQQTAAMLTTFNEVDLTEVMRCALATRERSRKSTASNWVSCRFSSTRASRRCGAFRRQRVDRRQRHRLSRVLRYRHRRVQRARAAGAGDSRRRRMSFADSKSHSDYGRRRARAASRWTTDRRHVHDHQRRRLRLDDVDADPESAAERRSWACTRFRNARWSLTARSVAADDVPGADLRSPHHRRREAVQFLVRSRSRWKIPAPAAADLTLPPQLSIGI